MTTHEPLLLVVDDVDDNRYTLTRRLRREGFSRVIEAVNGRDALDKLEAEPVDLVLLDIMMPEIDGFEVLRRMKADTRLRDVPVIIISASEDIDTIVDAIRHGAEDYSYFAIALPRREGALPDFASLTITEEAA